MKKNLVSGLIISLIIGSCARQELKSPNEGVWKILSWEHFTGDTLAWKMPGDYTGSEMKIASKSNFLWVGRYKKDTTFIDNYGGGTYKIEGIRLEQEILYAGEQSWIGTKARLLWSVKNDTAKQTWPCDENWQINKSDYGIQKWVRVE